LQRVFMKEHHRKPAAKYEKRKDLILWICFMH
jgi:hypothetical protein